MKRFMFSLCVLVGLGFGVAVADSFSGFAGICKSTGRLCYNQLPPPFGEATGSLTVSGTATATATYSGTGTGTITATGTVTGTGTGAGTGTLTGTGTGVATGFATLTKTATGTVTVTLSATVTGTSTVTERNISIGNASAAPQMLSIGTSGQTRFDAQGNETSSGTINLTGAGTTLAAGINGAKITLNSGTSAPAIGFNATYSGYQMKYGPGSNNQYGMAQFYDQSVGAMNFYTSPTPGYSGMNFTGTLVGQLNRFGDLLLYGALTSTNLTTNGHAIADLLLPASGVCAAGQVLTYLTTGAPTCVTNGTGTGVGCSGTCSANSVAVFTDSTHITNAPMSFSGNNATVTGTIAASNITATPGATKIPVSDGSGTVNAWVTKRMQNLQALVGPSSSGSTTGTTPLSVIGSTFIAVSAAGSLSVSATVNVSTIAGVNTCAVALALDGTQIGVQSVTNAGVATVPVAGIGTFTGGSYSLVVTLTSTNGAYGCGTQAYLSQMVITEYSN